MTNEARRQTPSLQYSITPADYDYRDKILSTSQPAQLSTSLVSVRFGQLKCVLHQFEAGFHVLADHDFHDVEAEWDIGIIEHAQPGEGAARDATLLIGMDGVDRPPEIIGVAGFYFDKDECLVVATNQIDLADTVSF